MATARKTPVKKTATKAAKAPRKAATKRDAAKKSPATTGRDADVRAARQFALEANFGLASRTRELLDGHRAAIQVLVDEHLPLMKIRDFIQQQFGPEIGPKALQTYLEQTFHIKPAAASEPARRPARKTTKKTTKKAAKNAAKKAAKRTTRSARG